MSEVIKDGLRLETEIEMLTLFGVSGFRCGGSWWITSPSGFKRIQPTSACADITKTIEVCIQDGNMGGINHIRISPYDGIILFLEAIIDVEMAQYAEAKNDTVVIGTISMNRVRLQGSNLMGQILTTSGGDPRGTDITIHPTRFVLQKGFLRYENMQVDVGDNPVNFKGVIGLDKSLDMTVTLPYTTEGRTARVGRETRGARITLPLKGTVDKPQLDMGKLIELQLKGQLEEQLRRGLEDLFK